MTNANDKAFGDKTVTSRVVDGKTESHIEADGLTKREHFASLAMQGLCASPDATYRSNPLGSIPTDAVAMADALILALNKDSQ